VTLVTPDLIAVNMNALANAMAMVTAAMALASVDRAGVELLAKLPFVPVTAITMVNVLMASAIAEVDILVRIAQCVLAHQTATETDAVTRTSLAIVPWDGPDPIVLSRLAARNAQSMEFAITEHVSASPDSLAMFARLLLARHLAQATEFVWLLVMR